LRSNQNGDINKHTLEYLSSVFPAPKNETFRRHRQPHYAFPFA
jgi:hypothetical protein